MVAARLVICLGLTGVFAGCSTTPSSSLKYSLIDIPTTSAPAHNLRVGVSWFSDALPRSNPRPNFDVGPATGKVHRGKVGGHIAIVLTNHLQHVNVFRETVFVGGDWKGKAHALDAQLTGTVNSFYSFYEYVSADKVGHVAGMFGGVLGGAAADQILFGLDRKYISEIVLGDVRLIESGAGKILWQGSISKRLEGTTTLQKNAVGDNAPWKQALKQALTALVGELQSARIKL